MSPAKLFLIIGLPDAAFLNHAVVVAIDNNTFNSVSIGTIANQFRHAIAIQIPARLLLSSCGNNEKLSISTPEKVYATYYSELDAHDWELSQDEINDWVAWLNNFTVSLLNLEESKALLE